LSHLERAGRVHLTRRNESEALNESYVRLYHDLGLVSLKLSNFADAISYFSQALSLDERNTDSLYHLAAAPLSIGNKAKAKDYLEQVLVLDPKFISNMIDTYKLGKWLRSETISKLK
jgi:tetratricopeptide (TPR) repeat protein